MNLEENVLDARHEAYIDWLCVAPQLRVPPNKTAYAASIGVADSTLSRWEKRDVFRRAWAKRVDDVVGSPERTKMLLDKLFADGMGDGRDSVASAKLFFAVTGKLQPAPMQVNVTKQASEMSDAELDGLIAAAAASELEARAAHS